MMHPASPRLSPLELTEEIDHFRNNCGWTDKRIEEYLGLADGTMAQRRRRESRKQPVEPVAP